MKAMSVIPGRRGSELIAESPEPPPAEGSILAEGLLVGICGTDEEVLRGHGLPPDGGQRLVIGHESLGRVLEAPPDAPVRPGDLVVGVVRRPDPVPCRACAVGEWDFCANGQYTERGIKGLDGYGATRWRVGPRFAIKVPARLGDLGVLTEPGSVVAKAWEQIDRISARAPRSARLALVAGAGPIGMLASLLALQRRQCAGFRPVVRAAGREPVRRGGSAIRRTGEGRDGRTPADMVRLAVELGQFAAQVRAHLPHGLLHPLQGAAVNTGCWYLAGKPRWVRKD